MAPPEGTSATSFAEGPPEVVPGRIFGYGPLTNFRGGFWPVGRWKNFARHPPAKNAWAPSRR